MLRVVFDTNVFVSALRSKHGASYALINALPSRKFQPTLLIPLYCEYLAVLNRPGIKNHRLLYATTASGR